MRLHKAGLSHRHANDFSICRHNGSGDWLLLVIKSPARFTVGGREYDVEPHSLILHPEGSPQVYGARACEYCDDWMHFEPEDTDILRIKALEIPIGEPFGPVDTTCISAVIGDIYREYQGGGPLAADSISLLFFLLLNRIRQALDGRGRPWSVHLQRFLDLRADIYLRPAEAWSVDRVAGRLNLSRSAVQHLWRELLGCALMDDIIESRLAQARQLLSTTNLTIYRIAESCGYASDVHFIRQFRQRMGTTPLQWRLSGAMPAGPSIPTRVHR